MLTPDPLELFVTRNDRNICFATNNIRPREEAEKLFGHSHEEVG